jgi:hypothetical protein
MEQLWSEGKVVGGETEVTTYLYSCMECGHEVSTSYVIDGALKH